MERARGTEGGKGGERVYYTEEDVGVEKRERGRKGESGRKGERG